MLQGFYLYDAGVFLVLKIASFEGSGYVGQELVRLSWRSLHKIGGGPFLGWIFVSFEIFLRSMTLRGIRHHRVHCFKHGNSQNFRPNTSDPHFHRRIKLSCCTSESDSKNDYWKFRIIYYCWTQKLSISVEIQWNTHKPQLLCSSSNFWKISQPLPKTRVPFAPNMFNLQLRCWELGLPHHPRTTNDASKASPSNDDDEDDDDNDCGGNHNNNNNNKMSICLKGAICKNDSPVHWMFLQLRCFCKSLRVSDIRRPESAWIAFFFA